MIDSLPDLLLRPKGIVLGWCLLDVNTLQYEYNFVFCVCHKLNRQMLNVYHICDNVPVSIVYLSLRFS